MPRRYWRAHLSSPLVFLGAVATGAFLVLIGVSMAQEIRRRYVLEQQIRALRTEIAARENRIAELRRLREYVGSDAYVERIAREKLNYRRPGERVVVIPSVSSPPPSPLFRENGPPPVSPARAWFRFLFGATRQPAPPATTPYPLP